MIGILAYGSLITDPGAEIQSATVDKKSVQTPFEVEYAHKSKGRAYAPTLVPVGVQQGERVNAQIYVLKPEISKLLAADMLYRRERDKVGVMNIRYTLPTNITNDTVLIDQISPFAGIETVLYTRIGSNLPEILDPDVDMEKKARLLAYLAVESLTKETFERRRDGIQYLLDNLAVKVITPLTYLYEAALIALSSGAPDLTEARTSFVRLKGILK